MRIGRDLIDEIIAHSREAYPVKGAEPREECCGLIGGRDGEMTSIHRARNAAESWLRFEVHPTDQLRIMEQLEADGEELAAIYHSHTESAAEPSQTDINLARPWPGVLWLICSLEDHDEPVVRGFWISDGKVEEEDLDVV
jgi:proteasome lid subunit RPN8/RPN11